MRPRALEIESLGRPRPSFLGDLEVNAEGPVPGLFSPVVADAEGQNGAFELRDIALGTRVLS